MAKHRPLALRVLGELGVIVLGVLIALWVDNLNSEQQARAQAEAHLAGILYDLGQDSSTLARRQQLAVRGLEAADRLMALRDDPAASASPDSLSLWFFQAAFVDNFEVLDHTYREVLGAGGLTAFSDEELRRAISSYYRSIESAEFFTEWYQGEETAYYDLLGSRMHPSDFAAITQSPDVGGGLSVSRVLHQLRSDPEVANAILMNRHWTELRLGITGRRLDANIALRAELRTHLSEAGAL
jgi:hypothetical protein